MTPAQRTNQIIVGVAVKHHITVAQIMSNGRARPISWPRQEAYYEVLRHTSLSICQVAKKFDVDHTTVIHGSDRHAERNGLPYIRDLRAGRAAA